MSTTPTAPAPIDAREIDLDPAAERGLADAGLSYRRIAADSDAFAGFLTAVDRGFLSDRATDEQRDFSRASIADRRLVGVYDGAALEAEVPVATTDSWVTELTTSPGRTVPAWAISAVTVSPTHRRRGIAGHLIGGELRAAACAGVAIAALTVSEATIYARWGFGPATAAASWKIAARRARWIGPVPTGRIDFLAPDEIPGALGRVHERVRRAQPGEVAAWPGLWRRMAGARPGDEGARGTRAVAYRDADGVERGVLVYGIEGREGFDDAEFGIRILLSDGDDAYAALWRFALEHDLIGTVSVSLRAVEEPVRAMIADPRAATVTVTDHEWLRVLDVPGALSSRAYAAPLDVVLDVADPLGLADGRYAVRVGDDGEAVVRRLADDETPATAVLAVPVGALGSILLGGVSPATLRSAGVVAGSPEAVAALAAAFAPAATPRLGIWY